MSEVSLLVCDDSAMARKQLLRALPSTWPVRVTQASDGRAGLEVLRRGGVDLVMLDLTMPELDGYQVLTSMREEGLRTQVIVISGDVQEEAVRRVMALGALAFLKKPVDAQELGLVLARLGFLSQVREIPGAALTPTSPVSFRETFQEVVNVAMGQAAALLAKVLGVYVRLPVPNVNILEPGELQMALTDAQGDARLTVVSQGYVAGAIAGEALLVFHDADTADVARLMGWQQEQASLTEMLLDLACVLIGACLGGIAEQLDTPFSMGHPQLLGEHSSIGQLLPLARPRWQKTLAVELSYRIEGHDIRFDLMLLFTEDSVSMMQQKLAYLMD